MLIAGQIALGLCLLVGGGELLVRGAVSLAAALRISPLVIGLTVVAFGTSAPELGVSVQAALSGNADVAIGNVVGSNIINVLLILGAASLITPLLVSSQLIRLDVPLMIAASGVLWLMASDLVIERWEGMLLFTALVLYIVFCIRKSRSENSAVVAEYNELTEEYEQVITTKRDLLVQIGFLLGGLVLLGFGSKLLVDGATSIAVALGVSNLVIGLTIVAIGTSLPEVVTSMVASYRGQRDIAVGNVVGSNLFNILCVLGLTATVAPEGVNVSAIALQFDLPVMVAVAVICFPIFLTGSVIRRWEGGLFLAYYLAYTAFVVVTAKSPLPPPTLWWVLVGGVLPLTILPIIASFALSRKSS